MTVYRVTLTSADRKVFCSEVIISNPSYCVNRLDKDVPNIIRRVVMNEFLKSTVEFTAVSVLPRHVFQLVEYGVLNFWQFRKFSNISK